MKRTEYCGLIRPRHIGTEQICSGRVNTKRDNVREDLRLRYRYLDIRRSGMVENLRMRHLIQKATHDYLDSKGFIYVETPIHVIESFQLFWCVVTSF